MALSNLHKTGPAGKDSSDPASSRQTPFRGGPRNAGIPLCADGLRLVIEPVPAGRLAPAVTLRVYSGGAPTNVGATLRAAQAEALAAAIVDAGRRAAGEFAMSPIPGPDPA